MNGCAKHNNIASSYTIHTKAGSDQLTVTHQRTLDTVELIDLTSPLELCSMVRVELTPIQ